MKEIIVRKAKKKDLEQLKQLDYELQVQMQQYRMKKLSKKQLERKKFNNNNIHKVIVAETEKTLIGFASFDPKAKDNEWCGKCIELEDIYVRPEFHGKTVGKGLLEKVLQEARKKAANIRLMMSPTNKRALKFYKKQGFETVGYEMVLNQKNKH